MKSVDSMRSKDLLLEKEDLLRMEEEDLICLEEEDLP